MNGYVAINISEGAKLTMYANVQINLVASRIITPTHGASGVGVSIGRQTEDPQLEGVKEIPVRRWRDG